MLHSLPFVDGAMIDEGGNAAKAQSPEWARSMAVQSQHELSGYDTCQQQCAGLRTGPTVRRLQSSHVALCCVLYFMVPGMTRKRPPCSPSTPPYVRSASSLQQRRCRWSDAALLSLSLSLARSLSHTHALLPVEPCWLLSII